MMAPKVLAANMRKVVGVFRSRRAVNGASAQRLADMRLNAGTTLKALVDSRIVRRAGADRYFLDEALWVRRRQVTGRTLLRVAVPTALALGTLFLWWSGR